MRLLLWQVAAMELELRDGAGIPIADLDAAVGGATEADDGAGVDDVDMAAPSDVIAAWMDMGGTAGSSLAAELIAGRESDAASGIDVVPQIVLVLFASDMALIGSSLPEAADPPASGWAAEPIRADAPVAPAQTGLCSSVIGFVNGVVASVFNAIGHLRTPPLVNTGFSPFDWFVNGAAKVAVGAVNAVIDGANFVISNTVSIAISTVMSYVGRIAGVVGTVAVVVSAIRPWALKVEADPPNVEAPGGGTIRAAVDLGGFDEWPPPVADCAAAAGVPLPALRPSGNPVTWSVPTQGLIAADSADPRLRADGSALYTYHVIKEPPLPNGPNVVEEIGVRATVQRDDFRRLEEQIVAMIETQLAQLLPPVGSVVSPVVMPLVRPWIDRAFRALSHLRDVFGVARIAVRYPDPNPPPTTTTPVGNAWSFAVFQGGAAVPTIAGYTCGGLASTWHVIVFPAGGPLLERTYDLAFTASTTTVHYDLVYDFPPDGESPAVHVEWRLDYFLDTAAAPPMIRITGTQHETPAGGSEVVFENNFGTGAGIPLENVSLPKLLESRGLAHPFIEQARAECGS